MFGLDLGDLPGWISAVVAVVSATVAAVSAWSSRQAKAEAARQAERAVTAAETSASEAARSAAAAERSAAAHETEADIAAGRVAAAERLPCRMDPVPLSENIELHNMTATPKYGVRVVGAAVRQPDVGTVDGNAHTEVDTLLSVMGLDKTITVTWHRTPDLSDEPLTWDPRLPRRIG